VIGKLTFNTRSDYETSIWILKLYLLNSSDTLLNKLNYLRANINNNGEIRWIRTGISESSCNLN